MANKGEILEGQDVGLMTDDDLKWEKDKLIKELYKLNENEEETEKSETTTSIKGIHLRRIRSKRRKRKGNTKNHTRTGRKAI